MSPVGMSKYAQKVEARKRRARRLGYADLPLPLIEQYEREDRHAVDFVWRGVDYTPRSLGPVSSLGQPVILDTGVVVVASDG